MQCFLIVTYELQKLTFHSHLDERRIHADNNVMADYVKNIMSCCICPHLLAYLATRHSFIAPLGTIASLFYLDVL